MNTYSGLEAFITLDDTSIVNIFRKSRKVAKKMPHDNIKTYVNEDVLKQMVNILSAFLPSDNKYAEIARKGSSMTNEELKTEFDYNVRKSYKFVTGRDPKNFSSVKTSSFIESTKVIASDIKSDLLSFYKTCETSVKIITKERALEILIFFEDKILPKLEELYTKVLLHQARRIGITVPEVLKHISMKTKKHRKALEEKLIRQKINTADLKSIDEYESFSEVLTRSIDEFVTLTRLDLIWDIFDKIINEIDSWR